MSHITAGMRNVAANYVAYLFYEQKYISPNEEFLKNAASLQNKRLSISKIIEKKILTF